MTEHKWKKSGFGRLFSEYSYVNQETGEVFEILRKDLAERSWSATNLGGFFKRLGEAMQYVELSLKHKIWMVDRGIKPTSEKVTDQDQAERDSELDRILAEMADAQTPEAERESGQKLGEWVFGK